VPSQRRIIQKSGDVQLEEVTLPGAAAAYVLRDRREPIVRTFTSRLDAEAAFKDATRERP